MQRMDIATVRRNWLYYLQQATTFLFLLYVLFLLGRSAKQNAASNQQMVELQAKIAELKSENDQLNYLILYEQTVSFKELEARRELGIKKPGEQVFILPNEPSPEQVNQTKQPNHLAPTRTVLTAWWRYFF